LKTLDIDYVLIDKNRNIGDNWALRYDNLRFHVPKSFVETPYIREFVSSTRCWRNTDGCMQGYPDEAPNLLHRDDLAEQMQRFAKELNLEDRVLLETTAESTSYDSSNQTWSLKLSSGKVVVCKHLVLATGILSSAPHVPAIESKENYQGVDTHSAGFHNAALLKEQGVKVKHPHRMLQIKLADPPPSSVCHRCRECKYRLRCSRGLLQRWSSNNDDPTFANLRHPYYILAT
jgi:cation diffusion facilitator CzcD-associated flavoprotein CzcO